MSTLSIDLSFSSDDNIQGKRQSKPLTANERKAVLEIYDQFESKISAIQVIKSINGFEHVNERKIKRWKKQATMNTPGRPISDEFENEVLLECERVSRLYQVKRVVTSNLYTYSLVKHCASEVLQKDYWDEETCSFMKKWLLDKRTCNLRFTNKWVFGVLRRELKKRNGSTNTDDVDDSLMLPGSPGQNSNCFNHFSHDDDSKEPIKLFDDSLPSLGNFNALDLEFEGLLKDLEFLDRDKSLSVSSISICGDDVCLREDLFDFDFDWAL